MTKRKALLYSTAQADAGTSTPDDAIEEELNAAARARGLESEDGDSFDDETEIFSMVEHPQTKGDGPKF